MPDKGHVSRTASGSEVEDNYAARPNWWPRARSLVSDQGILLTLLLFVAVFSLLRPATFFTYGNLTAILGLQAVMLIVALAVTIPLASGAFDLSVGPTVGFAMSLVAVLSVEEDWPWLAAMFVSVLAGAGVGSVNGFLIVRLGVDAFVVTLGTGSVILGVTLAMTDASVIGGIPDQITTISRTELFDIPMVTFYALMLAAVLWVIFEHTPLGRHLFFVGESHGAARLAGLHVQRIRFGAFVAAAAIAALAGVLFAGQLGSSDPRIGPSFLLPAYAAAFLGATTIKRGRFNAWGTVLALYLLATGITGLQLLGAPFWIEDVFNGVALTLAVTLAKLAGRET